MEEKEKEFELIIRLEYPSDKNKKNKKGRRSKNVNRRLRIEKENPTELQKTDSMYDAIVWKIAENISIEIY